MEKDPIGWNISAKGYYLCPCGTFKTYDLGDIPSHYAQDLGKGYCVRGIRCITEDYYDCICGSEFKGLKKGRGPYEQAFDHVYDQLNGIAGWKCVVRYRNTCKKCNIPCDSPKHLQRHYTTKSHINFEKKVELYCKICDIRYYGQKQMLTHLNTNKHKKKNESQCKNGFIFDKNEGC